MTKLLTFIATLVLVLFGITACGVPGDSSPRDIPRENVQYDLLATSTTSSLSAAPESTIQTTVYLLGPDNRLVRANRDVSQPLTVGALLGALIQGATTAEQTNGLRSAINQQTSVLGAEVENGVAKVDVSDAFSGVGAQEQILALAQLVYTATEVDGVSSVQVMLNSAAVEVPKGDGTLTRSPLTRADYSALAPI